MSKAIPGEPPVGDQRRVRQSPKRASYDPAVLYGVLDVCPIGHVSFVHKGQPQSIPTAIARIDDHLYLHGSRSSRMFMALAAGEPVCVSTCRVDALVKSRSAFHCSMNYRSAVVFGRGEIVTGNEKVRLLDAFTERLIPGSADDFRPHLAKEIKATELIRLNLNSASVKIRTGDPVDDDEDLALPYWAGIVPVLQSYGVPQASKNLPEGVALPDDLLKGVKP